MQLARCVKGVQPREGRDQMRRAQRLERGREERAEAGEPLGAGMRERRAAFLHGELDLLVQRVRRQPRLGRVAESVLLKELLEILLASGMRQ